MKKHLLTAALAIVALGGAVASTQHGTNAKLRLAPVYEKPNCTEVNCQAQTGTPCSTLILYSDTPDCQQRVFNVPGFRTID